MRVNAILETILYGSNLEELEDFYQKVLGLRRIAATPGRNVVLQCGNSALILFNADKSSQTGGKFPAHGVNGSGHIAFVIGEEELEVWRIHLSKMNIIIETEIIWEDGGISLYFRDPAGNSVELAPPTIWGGLGTRLLK
jgi:catechol-2,3-dioxygenase